MKKLVRILMWAHFIYLLLLPTLAVVAAKMLFPESEFWEQVALFGFPAVLMYTLFLANGYAIPDSLPIALIQTAAVPAQIALGVMLFGSSSIWLFFAESAAVEIGSFVLGVLTVALSNRRKDSGTGGFAFILLLAIALFFGGTLPYLLLVFYGYGTWSLWLILFVTAFGTGYWRYASSYKKLTATYKVKGQPQNLEMLFDGGVLARFFGTDGRVPLLSPLWKTSDRNQVNSRVFIFGFTAMFLPVVAAVVIGAAFK